MAEEEHMGCIDVNGKQFWECGCITFARQTPEGKEVVLVSCGNEVCPVLTSLHKISNEQGVPIRHRKG